MSARGGKRFASEVVADRGALQDEPGPSGASAMGIATTGATSRCRCAMRRGRAAPTSFVRSVGATIGIPPPARRVGVRDESGAGAACEHRPRQPKSLRLRYFRCDRHERRCLTGCAGRQYSSPSLKSTVGVDLRDSPRRPAARRRPCDSPAQGRFILVGRLSHFDSNA
jgi:hypothetical protein